MSEETKKKRIVLKKKGEGSSIKSKKPVIKLNKPPAEEEELGPATEVMEKEPAKQAQPEPKTEAAPKEEAPAAAEQPAKKAEEQPFKFYCVYCGQKLSASSAMTGRTISCPSCGHKIEVPQAP